MFQNEYIQEFRDVVMQITWFLLLLSQLEIKRTLIDNIFSNNHQDNQNQEVQYMLIYKITFQFTI